MRYQYFRLFEYRSPKCPEKEKSPREDVAYSSSRAELAAITVAKRACDWATEVTWTVSYTAWGWGSRIGHVRYINIQAWLRGFRVKIANFSSFFCPSIPKRDLDTKKTTPNIEVWPESLGAMLEYWYIECGLFHRVEWIARGPNGLVPFHSQNEFGAHLKWKMLVDHCCSLRIKASWRFRRWYQCYFVSCFIHSDLTEQCNGLFWADRSQVFAIWLQTPHSNRMMKMTIQVLSPKSSQQPKNTLCLRSSLQTCGNSTWMYE